MKLILEDALRRTVIPPVVVISFFILPVNLIGPLVGNQTWCPRISGLILNISSYALLVFAVIAVCWTHSYAIAGDQVRHEVPFMRRVRRIISPLVILSCGMGALFSFLASTDMGGSPFLALALFLLVVNLLVLLFYVVYCYTWGRQVLHAHGASVTIVLSNTPSKSLASTIDNADAG